MFLSFHFTGFFLVFHPNMTHIFSRQEIRRMLMKLYWTTLTVFRTHYGESFAKKAENDSKHFLFDDSTCDSPSYFRKQIMKCFLINIEKGKLEKLESHLGLRWSRTQAAAMFPRVDFAIIYFYSHSVSVYFYQQQNENRKM